MAFVEVAANSDSGAYQIDNSLRFPGESAELTREQDAGNRKTWTCSVWTKILPTTGSPLWGTPSEGEQLYFSSNRLYFYNEGSSGSYLSTNKLFRDPSAWYHLVIAYDTTQGTAANRVKLYVNGSQYTWDNNTTYPDEDDEFKVCQDGQNFRINAGHQNVASGGSQYYQADFAFVDGTAYDASYFGETNDNGVWIPKKPAVTWGTNGFFLEFQQTGTSQNASGIGADTSGNGNHFAVTDLTSTDVTTDTPTNNFATLNPLYSGRFDNTGFVYSEGNTRIAWTSNNDDKSLATSTIGVTKGKWYFEAKVIDNSRGIIGVGNMTQMAQFTDAFYDNDPSYGMGVYLPNGNLQENNSSVSDWSSDVSDNDICMLALDMDNHRCWFGINGTWQDSGDPTSGSTGTGDMTTQISDQSHINTGEFIFPFFGDVSGTEKTDISVNFGNPSFAISSGNADANGYGNFEYAPPSGFYALCSKNLAKYG